MQPQEEQKKTKKKKKNNVRNSPRAKYFTVMHDTTHNQIPVGPLFCVCWREPLHNDAVEEEGRRRGRR